MDLQEFISETLTQIINGVVDAQNKLKDTGCIINPEFASVEKGLISKIDTYNFRTVQKVKMKVALSVSENNEKSSKLGVAKFLVADFGNEHSNQNNQTNTVEFEIPIALPLMKVEND